LKLYGGNPRVVTVFDEGTDHPGGAVHTSTIRNTLRRIFPDPFFFDHLDEEGVEELTAQFHQALPLLKWSLLGNSLSLFFLARHRLNIGKFFYEMICRWLTPGYRVDVAFFFTTDFKLPELGSGLYTLVEMVVRLDDESDLEQISHNLHIIEAEIKLGMVSVYHASRILEVRSSHEKIAALQEKISNLIQRWPDQIDYDIFGEMQHFLVMSKDEFKASRDAHHLSRLIGCFYIFRKLLQTDVERFPEKRHVRLKLAGVNLDLPWGWKRVLGICVGLNFLKPNELFEERHLIKAIHNAIPGVKAASFIISTQDSEERSEARSVCTPKSIAEGAIDEAEGRSGKATAGRIPDEIVKEAVKAVQDSFFVNEGTGDFIHTFYIEIEKEDGTEFSLEEIRKIRHFLPEELKRSIEVALRPLFMPRNEEEVLRHIVTLSGQLRFVRDLPQVILSFERQTEADLIFNVILVRILLPESVSIQNLFDQQKSLLTYIYDRVKRVGMLRKRYPKEATVFQVSFRSHPFLRDDHSVDLYKARQEVIAELQRVVGEVRDYYGGMIIKQLELLGALKREMGELSRTDELLLESFFHALYPVEMRSVLPPEPLKKLFSMWKEVQEKQMVIAEPEGIFVMGKRDFSAELELLELSDTELLVAKLETAEEKFWGYIYFSDNEEKRQCFLSILDAKPLSD